MKLSQGLKVVSNFTIKMPLFIVSTPIGNLEDITIRAIATLSKADYILCENTQVSNTLLNAHKILEKRLILFTDHTREEDFLPYLEYAKTQNVALISDAGTPLISDPGYRLIKSAHELGIKVVSIPGASSITSAISVCGIPSSQFCFLGFFEEWKLELVNKILKEEISVIFFLPGRDIYKILKIISAEINSRDIAVTRELTKHFEDIKTGNIEDLLSYYAIPEKWKGEAVMIISGKQNQDPKPVEVKNIISEILEKKPFLKSLKVKDLSDILKTYEPEVDLFSKKEIYNALVEYKLTEQ